MFRTACLFAIGTAGGVLKWQAMCKMNTKGKVNSNDWGAAGVSAVPYGRTSLFKKEGVKANPAKFLLMHCDGTMLQVSLASRSSGRVFFNCNSLVKITDKKNKSGT